MRNIFALCLLLGAFLLINAVRVEAQITVPASLDPALNGAGSGVAWAAGTTNVNPARVSASALQPQDGKIIIAGGFNRFNGTPQGCIARLNSDGSLDGTFNVGGAGIGPLTQGWGTISAMVRQPDGKLIIGGFFSTYNGTAVNHLARLNANGSLDGTFTGSLGANASIIGMALQPDGKIIIAGNFSTYSGTTVKGLARLNSDGSLDGTFNVGTGLQRAGLAIGWSLAVQPDGKIIVGGLFKTYNGTSRNSLARLNSDGSLDNTFNIGTGVQTDQVLDKEGIVTGIAVQPDGKLIIVGEFKTYNGIKANNIARVNADGSMDTAFTDSSLLTPGTDSLVNTVVLQPDGKILIGGIFLGYNNRLRPILARINSNGTIDDTFDTSGSGVGLNERVESILVQPDGKIFVGGMFTQYDTTALPVGVARFLPATGGLIAFDGDVPPFFSQSLFSVNEGVSNAAITLKRQLGNDGRTVAQVTLGSGSATANDFSFPSVGALDLSFNYGSGKGANNVVNALGIQPDGKIVIGGNFTAYNGDPNASDGILRLNKDGTIDTTFNYGAGNGTLGSVNAVVIEPSGKILIGGNFTSYNGDASASDNILRLNANGTLDTSFNYGAGFGADATVDAIILQPDGKVIVGGNFTSYNSDNSASDRVLRLNPDGALDKVFFNYGAGKGANANVRALALQTDGKILVGGDFNAYNSDAQTSRCIMRLSALGELDTSFNYGLNMGADFAVRAMVLQPDGKIIIGGDFFAYNQDAAANDRVVRLNSNGSLDASFNYGLGRGADNPVFALALQPDGKVVIGGSFSSYSGDQNAGNRVLRLNTVGAIDTSFNYGSPTLGANGNVNALASRGDGKTVIGGAFSSYNDDPNAGDFVAQVGGEFLATWESGDFSVKTVLIPINDDSIEESTENRELVPSIVFGNSLISDISKPGLKKEAILFIGDNDLTISLVSGSGLVSGAATLTAKLTKNGLGLNNKTVNFSINGTAFGQATTNSSGVATFSGGTLTGINVGNYPNAVSANFPGDATLGVNSATGPLSVDKGNQTITLLPLADRPFNAPDFTVSATASSGLPVSFGVIGNCTIGGPQNQIVHLTGVLGSCTVVAAQIGDTNYNAAVNVSQTFNITKADQTITFNPLPAKTFGDSDFDLSASASSTLPVSFAPSGQCTLSTKTVHLTGAGSCQITASQGGDNFFNAASAQQSFTIARASQTISFNPPTNKTFGDADFPVSATGGASGNAVTFNSLTSAVCSVTVNSVRILNAGTCSIRASQAGNNDYDAATDVDRSVDVARAAQTITFNNLSSRTFGEADFSVSATSSSGLTVSFSVVGQCTLLASSVHLTGAGSCDVTASQSGDGNYNPASSVTQGFTIARASQTISFGTLVDKAFGDADFPLSATSSSGLSVSFAASGECTLNGNSVHLTGAGSCNITASQGGDTNYNSATDVQRSFNIGKGSQGITFGALASKTFGDSDFTVSATASSSLAVSFSASGNCTITGGNTVNLTGAGGCTITASQGGDANYLAANDVQQSFNIGKANQAITFGALATRTFGDSDFTVSATASSSLAVSLTASGNCSIIGGNTVHLTGAGGCTITASQVGDANYLAANNVQQSFNIGKANQTITFGALANKTFGDPDFTVSATASSTLAVSFSASGNCTSTGSTVHLTGGGSCTITAAQAGDADYNSAANVQQSFTITTNSAATTTTVSSSQNPSNLNQSVTFTATVAATGGTPAGTVQFKDGGVNLGPPQTVNGSGVATFSTSTLIAGLHPITADYSGDANFLASSGTLAGGQQVGSIIRFSANNYSTNEDSGFTTITVQRVGDLTQPVTVDFGTPDDSAALTFLPCASLSGVASPRCDFETALGTLRWAAGDGTDKTFTVLINQDSFRFEGAETLTLTLSNPTGSVGFAAGANSITATLTIVDDDFTPATTNPIDETQNFVRQLYHDFLNREADPAGLNFWTNNITSCGTNQACIETMRINTSAAFFLSIEFQNTGFFVTRMHKTAFGDIGPTAPVPLKFIDFIRDTQQVGAGVIVGQGSWLTQLVHNKSDFALTFVQRAPFINRYPASMNAAAFVDSLNSNTGNVLSDAERAALIGELAVNPSDPALRADALRRIAENANFQQRQFTCAFVLMQYFGYLRRNPDAAPEMGLNFDGYNFWLTKLNQFNGDYIKAEMVKAFLSSIEYRQRFGP